MAQQKATGIEVLVSVSKDIDLLLIGKTGNGKSALGNMILGEKKFISCSNTSSVTSDVCKEYVEYKTRALTIVDAPGVGDTRGTDEEAVKLVSNKLEKAVTEHPQGYHAFILVVRYGGRFTQEDVNCIEMLKKIFGQNFVKEFCILAMTCGDNFEDDVENTDMTFEKWWREQTGVFKTLADECAHRVLLFNNKAKKQKKREQQIDALIAVVDGLKAKGKRYTDKHFEIAMETRKRFMIESQLPIVEEETTKQTRLVLNKLNEIEKQEPYKQLPTLHSLLNRIDNILASVKKQDKGTGVLSGVIENVASIKRTVETEIKLCERMIEKQKNQHENLELQKCLEEFKLLHLGLKQNEQLFEMQRAQERKLREVERKKSSCVIS